MGDWCSMPKGTSMAQLLTAVHSVLELSSKWIPTAMRLCSTVSQAEQTEPIQALRLWCVTVPGISMGLHHEAREQDVVVPAAEPSSSSLRESQVEFALRCESLFIAALFRSGC